MTRFFIQLFAKNYENSFLHKNRFVSRQNGLGLLEVLIALLIIMASYSLTTNLISDSSKKLRQAKQLLQINGLVEIIKSDLESNSLRWETYTKTHSGRIKQGDTLPNVKNCFKQKCTEENLIGFHWTNWQKQIEALNLNNWSLEIRDTNNTFAKDILKIYIRWDANDNGSTGTQCPVASKNDLDCFQFSLHQTKPLIQGANIE